MTPNRTFLLTAIAAIICSPAFAQAPNGQPSGASITPSEHPIESSIAKTGFNGPSAGLAYMFLKPSLLRAMNAELPEASISVTGEAEISAAPDQAEIEAGVTSEAKTARAASEANNTAMGQLLLALKAASIDSKDIQTSRLSLQPEYAPNHNPPAVVGYRVSNHVTVHLRDVLKVASTIDMMVGAGATDIGGINFMVSQASKLLDTARAAAIADARRKAEIYAKAAGVTLGAPLSISEGSSPGPLFRGKMLAAAPMALTPVAQGEETLRVTVNVSWAIAPAAATTSPMPEPSPTPEPTPTPSPTATPSK